MGKKENRKRIGGATLLAWKMESKVMVQESLWFLQLKRQDNELLPRAYRGIQAFTALIFRSMAVC